uniref:Uncharacterized protein n=1 Tax=Eutreptiella gymnastica TaxID=73025 RepID=A0A7S4G0L6_9EUGL
MHEGPWDYAPGTTERGIRNFGGWTSLGNTFCDLCHAAFAPSHHQGLACDSADAHQICAVVAVVLGHRGTTQDAGNRACPASQRSAMEAAPSARHQTRVGRPKESRHTHSSARPQEPGTTDCGLLGGSFAYGDSGFELETAAVAIVGLESETAKRPDAYPKDTAGTRRLGVCGVLRDPSPPPGEGWADGLWEAQDQIRSTTLRHLSAAPGKACVGAGGVSM